MKSLKMLSSLSAKWLHWLWLLIGFVFIPFTAWQTVIPLAAWLAPVFLLRFARTSVRMRGSLWLIFAAYALGILISVRGLDAGPQMILVILGLIQIPLLRGLMYTLPYAADRLLGARLGASGRLLVFPLAFTTVDWVMSLMPVINSSGSPAYSQYDNLALLQLLSITGMWGMTFIIMWSASTVNALWEQRNHWRPVALFASVLAAIVLFGSLRLNFAPPASQTVPVATITIDQSLTQNASNPIDWVTFNQSNDGQRAAARPRFAATVDQMLERSEKALRAGAKIVGWQEFSALTLEEDKSSVIERAAALARQYHAYLQITLWVATRSQTLPYIHNQSILIDSSGSVVWTYDKTHPVVPGEAYVTINGSGKLPVAATPYGRLSTAICNDLHFPPLLRQAGQNGTAILLAPYDDIPPLGSEDAVVATYRAVENGFSLLRATGQGASTIVDYQGRILGSQNYFTDRSGIMLANLPVQGVTTIYSRIGDAFAYLCAAGLIVLAVWAFARRARVAAVAPRLPA